MGLQKSDNSDGKPMSAVTHLQTAKSWATIIDDQAYAKYGDRIVGRKALARQYGWAQNALRCLRYGQTKSISMDFWAKLSYAVEDALRVQRSRIDDDLRQISALRSRVDLDAHREAYNQAAASLEALKAFVGDDKVARHHEVLS